MSSPSSISFAGRPALESGSDATVSSLTMLPSPHTTGATFLIMAFSAFPGSGVALAQDGAVSEGAVNQGMTFNLESLHPIEIEYESVADDGRRLVTTVRYTLDSASGQESLVKRRWDEEYLDWSDGYPKKTRHFKVESIARSRDLRPVRTDIVNQYWDDAAAAWLTQRWKIVYEPGRVTREYVGPDTTSFQELDLPDGILEGTMVGLAVGLLVDPPRELVVTSYDWRNNVVQAWQYDVVGRESMVVAGREYDAVIVQTSNPETSDVRNRVYYRANVPRVFLGVDDPESDVIVTRVREGP